MSDVNLVNLVQSLSAVCLFAGDIAFLSIGDEKIWGSTPGLASDKTGPTFSMERVLAAEYLYHLNKRLIFVVSGGCSNVPGQADRPTISSVVKRELVSFGVPKDQIIEDPHSQDTWEQLQNCALLVRERRWLGSNVAILAPSWQFGRILSMITWKRITVRPFRPNTPFISMERVLIHKDPNKWCPNFKHWYQTPEAINMFASEALGTGQLLTGCNPSLGLSVPYTGFKDPAL